MVYFKLVLVTLFWGGTFLATKIAGQYFGPFTGAALRFIFAMLLLMPLVLVREPSALKMPKQQMIIPAIMGLAGIFGYNYFFFTGLQLVPAARGALIVALNPSMVMLASALSGREALTARRAIGIAISFLGALIVISRGNLAGIAGEISFGDVLMLGCPLTWAVYTLFSRRAAFLMSSMATTFWSVAFGLAMLVMASFAENTNWPGVAPVSWLALAYLGIFGTVLGFWWYNEGIRQLGPTKTAIFNNLVPVFGVSLSVLLLNEPLTLPMLLGGFIVISGVILTVTAPAAPIAGISKAG